MTESRADTATELLRLDHLALRVADPEALAQLLCGYCGMQRTESRGGFSVLGTPAARSRLFLLQAEEPPDTSVLQRVVLRVSDLEGAVARLPEAVDVERVEPETAVFEAPEGLEIGFTSVLGGGVDYDLDNVVLRVGDPDDTAFALAELGFVYRGGALQVADKYVYVHSGSGSTGERERLRHIGVLVESVAAVQAQALRAGLEIDEATLPPNRFGVNLRGPERIRIEYSDRASRS